MSFLPALAAHSLYPHRLPERPLNTMERELEAILFREQGERFDRSAAEASEPVLKPGGVESQAKPASAEPKPWSAEENRWGIGRRLSNAFKTLLDKGDSLGSLIPEVLKSEQFDETTAQLTDVQLQAKTAEFRQRLQAGESLKDVRPEAFSVAREACHRVLGKRPRDVQVLAGVALDEGKIAEMATGEGKTLSAVLPVYLNALTGRGSHVVTVNDTLATRDAQEMGQVYKFLGLSVGLTTSSMEPAEKRAAYQCDVTYGSNDVFGFDFLHGRSLVDASQRILTREPNFVVVDEVDQILIDESTTPLIVAAPGQQPSPDFKIFSHMVSDLVPRQELMVDPESQTAHLTERGMDFVNNELTFHQVLGKLQTHRLAREEAERQGDKFAAARQSLYLDQALDWGQRTVKLRGVIRQRGKVEHDLKEIDANRPSLLGRIGARVRSALGLKVHYDFRHRRSLKQQEEQLRKEQERLETDLPKYDVYAKDNFHRLNALHNAVEARALFHENVDYVVVKKQLERLEEGLGLEPPELMAVAQVGFRFQVVKEGPLAVDESRKTIHVPDSLLAPGADSTSLKRVAEALRPTRELQPVRNSSREILRQIAANEDGTPLSEGEIKLIDEFKGRASEGRRYSSGLHQALEAKHGLPVRAEQRTLASTTYTNLFGRYPKFAGMTGTATAAAEEFREVLNLDVVSVPRHKPLAREDLPDRPFPDADLRDKTVVADAITSFQEGRPTIVFTPTVEHNQKVSRMLTEAGIPHNVLNVNSVSERTEEELRMIKQAGRSGGLLVATNMASRGQDPQPELVNSKKLSLVLEEKLQDDPEARITVDVEDHQHAEWLGEWLEMGQEVGANIPYRISHQAASLPEPGTVVIRVGVNEPVTTGTHLKGSDFPTRGMNILAASRNSARRIDDQVVGRAGRGGQPGTTCFYTCPEDEVATDYGRDKELEGIEREMNHAPDRGGEALEDFVSRAQSVFESRRQSGRIKTIKDEQILDLQRQEFYGFRDKVLESGPDTAEPALNLREELVSWASDSVTERVLERLAGGANLERFLSRDRALEADTLHASVLEAGRDLGLNLNERAEETVRPSGVYDFVYPQVEKALNNGLSRLPAEQVDETIQRGILLGMNSAWADHLEAMEELQQSVGLQTYAQQNPDEVYKHRAYDQFVRTVHNVRHQGAQAALSLLHRLAANRRSG